MCYFNVLGKSQEAVREMIPAGRNEKTCGMADTGLSARFCSYRLQEAFYLCLHRITLQESLRES